MRSNDRAMLYQAYAFKDEKRVEAENYYVTAGGVVYKQYTIDGGVTDLRPVSLANITGQRIVIRITAPSVGDRKCKEDRRDHVCYIRL